jgi:small subunit ribosomal protein S9
MPRIKTKKETTAKRVKTKAVKKTVEPEKEIVAPKQPAVVEDTKKIDYVIATGRRKASIARVRYYRKGNGEIQINDKPLVQYFPYFEFQKTVTKPLEVLNKLNEGSYSIKVTGGGTRGQADAIRLGISRIQFQLDNTIKPALKVFHLLTRDSRIKERKKYGLKKARRAPQWQKR